MPATPDKPTVRWPRVSPSARRLLIGVLGVSEKGMAAIRRDLARRLTRTELHFRAWREALDPSTSDWITQARLRQPTSNPEEIRDDLKRRIDEVRSHV